jgi:hypothetical protein
MVSKLLADPPRPLSTTGRNCAVARSRRAEFESKPLSASAGSFSSRRKLASNPRSTRHVSKPCQRHGCHQRTSAKDMRHTDRDMLWDEVEAMAPILDSSASPRGYTIEAKDGMFHNLDCLRSSDKRCRFIRTLLIGRAEVVSLNDCVGAVGRQHSRVVGASAAHTAAQRRSVVRLFRREQQR